MRFCIICLDLSRPDQGTKEILTCRSLNQIFQCQKYFQGYRIHNHLKCILICQQSLDHVSLTYSNNQITTESKIFLQKSADKKVYNIKTSYYKNNNYLLMSLQKEIPLQSKGNFTGNASNQSTPERDKKQVFVIGICGGDCSGKRQIVQNIQTFFKSQNAKTTFVPQRSFFVKNQKLTKYHPNSYDWNKMIQCVQSLKNRQLVQIKKHDLNKQQNQDQYVMCQPSDIVIVHGLHILYNVELKNLLDISIFVDSDCDLRLSRRIERDSKSRKRSLQESLQNYLFDIKPNYQIYTLPLKKVADLLVPEFERDFVPNSQNHQNQNLHNENNRIMQFLLPSLLKSARTQKINVKSTINNLEKSYIQSVDASF